MSVSQASFGNLDEDWDSSVVSSLSSPQDRSLNCGALPIRPTISTALSSPDLSCPPSTVDPLLRAPLPAMPPRFSSPMGPAYLTHPRYYFQDEMAVFLVDGYLFRVHRFFLDRESVLFPHDTGTRDDPIKLSGVTKPEFESLLDFLYEGMHNDQGLPPLSSWTALLSVSSHFSMARIRSRAISEIITYPAPGLDPVDQVALATKHDIPDWLHPGYAALCQRENALEFEEAEKLGMKTTVLVAKAREAARKQAAGPVPWFKEGLVNRVVNDVFWPASGRAPVSSPVLVQTAPPLQPQEPKESETRVDTWGPGKAASPMASPIDRPAPPSPPSPPAEAPMASKAPSKVPIPRAMTPKTPMERTRSNDRVALSVTVPVPAPEPVVASPVMVTPEFPSFKHTLQLTDTIKKDAAKTIMPSWDMSAPAEEAPRTRTKSIIGSPPKAAAAALPPAPEINTSSWGFSALGAKPRDMSIPAEEAPHTRTKSIFGNPPKDAAASSPLRPCGNVRGRDRGSIGSSRFSGAFGGFGTAHYNGVGMGSDGAMGGSTVDSKDTSAPAAGGFSPSIGPGRLANPPEAEPSSFGLSNSGPTPELLAPLAPPVGEELGPNGNPLSEVMLRKHQQEREAKEKEDLEDLEDQALAELAAAEISRERKKKRKEEKEAKERLEREAREKELADFMAEQERELLVKPTVETPVADAAAAASFDPLDDPAWAKLTPKERKKKQKEAKERIEREAREKELADFMAEQENELGGGGDAGNANLAADDLVDLVEAPTPVAEEKKDDDDFGGGAKKKKGGKKEKK